jgi:lipopolysaccharide export system protein LptC
MLKDPRNLLWIVPLVALLTMPLWRSLAADMLSPMRKETGVPAPSLTNTRALSSSEMNGVQFEQSRNGIKEWLLTASRLYSTESDASMQLEDVKALFFGDKGYEMQTDSLEYLAAEKKIRTTSAVTIQGRNIEVRANQLLYDTVTGNYSLEGDVVCKVW